MPPAGTKEGQTWRALTRRCAMRAFGALIALGGLVLAVPSRAADRILDQLTAENGSVVVQFNCAMSYVSNYPQRSGDELRIELQPLAGCPPASRLGETLPVPAGNGAGLTDVRLDQSLGTRQALILHFARTIDFLIRPRPGLTGIEVVVGRRSGRAVVEPANPPASPSRAAVRQLPPPEELERMVAEARQAMQDRDYDTAIRLYTRLLEFPEHPARAQAQEYLGLARERKGQLAQAKAEYQEYLKRYPDGADADAVRQRLAALVTLDGASKPARGAPDASRWSLSGAVAQEYRNDHNTLVSGGVSSDGVGQAALDSNVDLELKHRGEIYDFKSRIYAGYLSDLHTVDGFAGSELMLPQAYAELDNSREHWVARLGRQSQPTGGLYGTFDGGYFGWLVTPGVRLGLAAGSPLETYAANVSHDREFANLSAEFLGVLPGIDLTTFLYGANVHGIKDARQIGLEGRYFRDGHSVVAQLDYDADYKVLNAATLLTSWSLPDRWTLTGIADHRKTPFIETFDALIGQATTSLTDLVQTLGLQQVRALAVARSASSDTFTFGLQHPVGERLQWGVDGAYAEIGGTPASGGVPAVPPSGSAVSVSTELLGGGWLVDRDMNTAGLSYTTRAGTKVASAYMSARYPLGDALRVGPRLQVSHTTGNDPNTGTSAGWSLSPSLLGDWRFSHGVVQFEAGYEKDVYQASLAPGVPIDPNNPNPLLLNQQSRRFWFSVGYMVNF